MAEKCCGVRWSEESVTDLLRGGSKEVARISGVSVRTLRRRFRRRGITLRDLILAKRAAVVLNLMQAGLPLGSIAVCAGLSSSPALNRFIRHEFGTTPARLAAQLRVSEPSNDR
jgi:AraC-like DNA-binding protein